MKNLPEAAQLAIFLAMACVAAGVFGMIHNQVSYTIGPDYFHRYKFIQFNVIETFPPRLAALIIGWKASWWMGLIIGVPLFTFALLARDKADYASLCFKAFVTVLVTILLVDSATIIAAFAVLTPENLPPRFTGPGDWDHLGFARAGLLHDASYLGAILGLLLAALRMVIQIRRARRIQPQANP